MRLAHDGRHVHRLDQAGLLAVEEADANKLTLDGGRFNLSFASYRELVK